MEYFGSKIIYHIKTLFGLIEWLIMTVILDLFIIFVIEDPYNRLQYSIIIVNILIFLIIMLPELVMYLRYLKVSRDVLVVIDHDKKEIQLQFYDSFKKYSFNDVIRIYKICSMRAYERKNSGSKRGEFFYFEIDLKNNEEILVTSLMTDKSIIEIGDKKSELLPQSLWISLRGRNIINLKKLAV